MPELLNQLLAGQAAQLVHESFTGVEAEWWWERRIGGGIAICQTLDPEAMAEKISRSTGVPPSEAKEAMARELGIEDPDPLTLTFELSGDTPTTEASKTLEERSSSPEGIAAGLYEQLEKTLKTR